MARGTPEFETLRIRRLADRSRGSRQTKFDPDTGEKYLFNPERGIPEPWPLAGVQIEGDIPAYARVSTTLVYQGVSDGWIELGNEKVVTRQGGPPEDLNRVTHTFRQAETITMHLVDGDVNWKVIHNPDKYVAEGGDGDKVTNEIYNAGDTRVDWFFDLERLAS